MEKHINNAYEKEIFNFAMKQKVNAKDSEKEFLKFYQFKKPLTIEDKQIILDELVIRKEINNASFNLMNKSKWINVTRVLYIVFSLVFYLLFLYTRHVTGGLSPYIFIPMLFMLIINLVQGRIKRSFDAEKPMNFAVKEFNKFKNSEYPMSKPGLVNYVQSNYKSNPEFYNELVKSTTRSKIFSFKPLQVLRLIKNISSGIIFVIIFIPFIRKLNIVNNVITSLITISVSINLIITIINVILDIIAFVLYNKSIERIKNQ